MVRATGYLKTLDDFRAIPLRASATGVPVRLGDVAHLQMGPELRRGIAELDGEGEVTGGIIVMRSGKNALATIEAVKKKIEQLKAGLPPGRRDRGDLRPLGADQALGREPHRQARRRVHRRRAGVFRFPVSPALGAGRDRFAAARHAHGVHRHALPGSERQHHVARRHRDRDRRDGRCRDRHDREPAQAPGTLACAARGSRARCRANAGRWSPKPACRWGRRCSSACSSSRCRSFPSSRSRRRKDDCSHRWRTRRPMRWPRPPGSR